MKFLIPLALTLPLSLFAAPPSVNTYIGLQYRHEDLQWTAREQPSGALLAKAHWQQIHAAELRLGAQLYPFECTSRQLSPQVNAFLNSLSLCVDGGVLLHSVSKDLNFHLDEDDESPQKHELKGKTSHIHGGDASIFVLQQCKTLYNCTLLFSLGYNVQNRTLHTPMRVSSSCEGTYDIDQLNYKTYWHGPWLGVGAVSLLDEAWKVFADFEYHRCIWRGNNKFNSLETLADRFCFENSTKISQKGFLNGFKLKLGTIYAVHACFKLFLDAKLELFQGGHGQGTMHTHQKLHHAAGHLIGNTKISQPAKPYMQWKSWAISGGLGYNF